MYFPDSNFGYAVGETGTIVKTTNAGLNWTIQNTYTSYRLHSVFFPDADTGYAVGEVGSLLRTVDGGITWTYKNLGISNSLNSVYFTDTKTGYIVGDDNIKALILKTTDGGNTWTDQSVSTYEWITSVFFVNGNVGFAAGTGGMILKTINGGVTKISDLHNNKLINLYPNPASNKLNIDFIDLTDI